MTQQPLTLFWFRRDLRLDDNRGLFEALKEGSPVLPIFIFDQEILKSLPQDDHRVTFIFETLLLMGKKLESEYASSIDIRHGKPEEIWKDLVEEYSIKKVFINHDYEPYARNRDETIKTFLENQGIELCSYKDQVIFEKNEVTKDDGNPYVVYTPYKNKWRNLFNNEKDLETYEIDSLNYNFYKNIQSSHISLSDMGFVKSDKKIPPLNLSKKIIEEYAQERDYPALEATSHVGPYLRFGLISIRKLMKQAHQASNPMFMNELIWREFFMQILWYFPYTKDRSFREKYDAIAWINDEDDFEKWKNGTTGFPMVDAGMRQLNQTGYMHNRVRMVVASFLCKHLLIDWRWGEAYFAEKLFDYDMASNVGNWQWAAGSGVDAAPYFRIFNPETQMKKFDPESKYVRKWVPEYFGLGYVSPVVEHAEARERALETYKYSLDNYGN